MKFLVLCLLTATCFFQSMLGAYVSSKPTRKTAVVTNRSLYPALASRFQDTLKTHPPVSECELVFQADDRLTITIEVNRDRLYQYLSSVHQIQRASPSDAERYLSNFRKGVKQAAAEIFADMPIESIEVRTHFAN